MILFEEFEFTCLYVVVCMCGHEHTCVMLENYVGCPGPIILCLKLLKTKSFFLNLELSDTGNVTLLPWALSKLPRVGVSGPRITRAGIQTQVLPLGEQALVHQATAMLLTL